MIAYGPVHPRAEVEVAAEKEGPTADLLLQRRGLDRAEALLSQRSSLALQETAGHRVLLSGKPRGFSPAYQTPLEPVITLSSGAGGVTRQQ